MWTVRLSFYIELPFTLYFNTSIGVNCLKLVVHCIQSWFCWFCTANVDGNSGGTGSFSPPIPGIDDTDIPATGDIGFLDNDANTLGQTYLMIIPALLFGLLCMLL